MFFTDPLQSDVQQQLSTKVNLLSKVVWPALATLVPAAVTALAKITQDHSRKRLSEQLADRISKLARNISELPQVSVATATGVTPLSVLEAELNAAVNELTALQFRASHRFAGVSTTTTRVRAALLLYRPKGLAAVTLHTLFYVYSFSLIFCLVAVMADQSSPFISTASAGSFFSDLLAFIVVFGVLGIPPLIIRYYAVKIHRRQCVESQAATVGSGPAPAVAQVSAPGQ
jgi:hypothetical protein